MGLNSVPTFTPAVMWIPVSKKKKTRKKLDIKQEFVIKCVQMNPNIWHSFIKSILKYQASITNSCWEICDKNLFESLR